MAHRNPWPEPRTAAHGTAAAGHGRLHGIRRGAHLRKAGKILLTVWRRSTPNARRSIQKFHAHPCAFRGECRKLDPKRVEQALKLSAEKYCSASIMLAKTAEITHDFEIVELP